MTTPTTVPVRLQLRADTAANWTSVNPILLANELGRETDTGKIKIGNGTSTWTSLAYQAWATLPVAVNAGGTGQTSYTNGQLLIGNTTGNTLTKATLTAGSGVAITNGTGSITVAVDSTVVTTAQTGTVTSTMIADGTIVDADVNASAAIAGTKISPNFGSQNVVTTGTSTAASLIPTGSTVPGNGVYLPAANSVGISTNGTGRLFVDSSGRVLVTTSIAYSVPNYAGSAITPQVQTSATTIAGGAYANIAWYTGAANGPNYVFARSNSATPGTYTAVSASSSLGNISFAGSDGTGFVTGANIAAQCDGTPGTGSMPGRLVFSTTPSGSGTPTERMRLDSSGRLGLGTSSPVFNLENVGNTRLIFNQNFSSSSDNTGKNLVLSSSGASAGSGLFGASLCFSRLNTVDVRSAIVAVNSASNFEQVGLTFWTHPTSNAADPMVEAMRINHSGFVGIGTTSPSFLLDVAGSARLGAATGDVTLEVGAGASTNRNAVVDLVGDTTYSDYGLRIIRGNGGANADSKIQHRGTGALVIEAQEAAPTTFFTGGSERARIDSSGRLGLGTSSPTRQFEVINPSGAVVARIGNDSTNHQEIFWNAGAASFRSREGSNNGRFSFFGNNGTSDTEFLRITAVGNVGIGTTSPSSLLHLADAGNITVGTTTGTKIGTATTQKLGFYNATPVAQPTAVADATDAATAISQLNALLAHMRTLGLIAT
jgi:ribosomal protein L24E